jgi:hydroxymethylbilane synthase
MTQTRWVADRVQAKYPDWTIEIVTIRTKGDIMQDVSLAKVGGKGLFVKEIEEALVRKEIDFAVHSMKDIPSELPEGLEIGITPEREDPRDVLVSRERKKLEELPRGARIGTGSLRRRFQLLNLLPDIEIIPLRGNLDTRIRKIETEGLDGVVVAAAGIRRMGWVSRVSQFISAEVLLPAVGQGAIGIELRQEDWEIKDILSFLNHGDTSIEVRAERAFLRCLGSGCQLPIAAYGKRMGDAIRIQGLIGSLDGRTMIRDEVKGRLGDASSLGVRLAENILGRGGQALLEEAYKICD